MSAGKSKKMDWELIEDKLDEARFFLGHLHDEKAKQARPNKPPPAPFRRYLSAFMTAARSVTDLIERGGSRLGGTSSTPPKRLCTISQKRCEATACIRAA
jgi:hypothetical protein